LERRVRRAAIGDLDAIRRIYNEGIEDRMATLEARPKSARDVTQWWSQHDGRYAVLVSIDARDVVGWASLNRFSHRCAHDGIADLSVYVARSHRGRGIGTGLLFELERIARSGAFHKIVLYALNANAHGKRLYRRAGFEKVGVFRQHGVLEGRHVDVVAMEKLL
jgi:L-amino acid N-acyltransferase YncA